MPRHFTLLSLVATCALGAQGLELPDLFSSNAVLQQQADARIWGWTDPGRTVTLTASWDGDRKYTAKAGADGRFDIAVATPAASYTPQAITITDGTDTATLDNLLIGEVWFASGQSNMEMPLRGFGIQPIEGAAQAIAYAGKYPHVRMATVPKLSAYTPQRTAPGTWRVSSPKEAPEFSALAYFFALSLSDILDVPVGIITSAYGGASVEGWTPREILDTYPGYDMAREEHDTTIDPWARIGVMYNAMLAPVAGYTVKGFLWNQGESNVDRPQEYASHQRDMVEHWRKDWGNPDLPFYFVEMPPWSYSDPEAAWAAYFREAQHEAARITPHSGIVCTSDLILPSEVEDVHASRKQPIGERLAFMAAARTYGIEGVPDSYPRYESVSLEGDKAVLTFSNRYGGLNPNLDLKGFEVAGDDRVFHPATATEDWNTYKVTVSSPEVADIKAVRYCFKNFAPGTLHDMMGMPLIPFRTDSWPIDTVNQTK